MKWVTSGSKCLAYVHGDLICTCHCSYFAGRTQQLFCSPSKNREVLRNLTGGFTKERTPTWPESSLKFVLEYRFCIFSNCAQTIVRCIHPLIQRPLTVYNSWERSISLAILWVFYGRYSWNRRYKRTETPLLCLQTYQNYTSNHTDDSREVYV